MDEMFPEGAGPYVDLDEVRRAAPGRGASSPARFGAGPGEGSGLRGPALALPAVPALAPGPWEACGRRPGLR